jgi:hypothetical protein
MLRWRPVGKFCQLYDVISMSFVFVGRNKSNSDMATVVGKRETGRLYPCTVSFCTTYRSLLEADHDVFRVMSSIRHNRRSVAAAQSNSTGMDLRSAHLPSNLDLMHLMVDTVSAAAISSRLTSVMSTFPLPAVRRHDMRKNITRDIHYTCHRRALANNTPLLWLVQK